MIKHIVMFKIKDGVDGRSKAESIAEAKRQLEALNGRIPGLISLEVGVDYSATDASADMIIYSVLESREAVDAYAVHPEHTAILPFLKSIFSERRLVDYEVEV
jgi:hypothetical protein